MPGGETLAEAADRMQAAAERLAKAEEEDVVIVTHDGAIRALLWRIMQLDTTADMIRCRTEALQFSDMMAKRLTVGLWVSCRGGAVGPEITELWRNDMPDHIRAHCRAVSRNVTKIQESLASAGHLLSQEASSRGAAARPLQAERTRTRKGGGRDTPAKRIFRAARCRAAWRRALTARWMRRRYCFMPIAVSGAR